MANLPVAGFIRTASPAGAPSSEHLFGGFVIGAATFPDEAAVEGLASVSMSVTAAAVGGVVRGGDSAVTLEASQASSGAVVRGGAGSETLELAAMVAGVLAGGSAASVDLSIGAGAAGMVDRLASGAVLLEVLSTVEGELAAKTGEASLILEMTTQAAGQMIYSGAASTTLEVITLAVGDTSVLHQAEGAALLEILASVTGNQVFSAAGSALLEILASAPSYVAGSPSDGGSTGGIGPGGGATVTTRPRHWSGIRVGAVIETHMSRAGLQGHSPVVRILGVSYRDGDSHLDLEMIHLPSIDQRAIQPGRYRQPFSEKTIQRLLTNASSRVSRSGNRLR